MLGGIVAALFLCLSGASTGSATDSTGLCSMFTKVNIPFYDLACRHSENCVENKSIAMSCGEYVLRTNEIFSCGKHQTNASVWQYVFGCRRVWGEIAGIAGTVLKLSYRFSISSGDKPVTFDTFSIESPKVNKVFAVSSLAFFSP